MQLYEKIMVGKKTTYRPYVAPDNTFFEIPQDEVVTILAVLTMSMLMSVSTQIKQHTRAAREIKKVEEAVQSLCALNACKLEERVVDIAVASWNSAIRTLQEQLSGGQHEIT